MQSFEHTALLHPTSDFRVVEVLPEQPDGLIRCRLSVVPISPGSHQYKALSYLWGVKAPPRAIQLDGKLFGVGDNLFCFLQHAQSHFSCQPLFIDAMCIDQTNIPERNCQVRMMGQIYQHADLVIAWLGEDVQEGLDDALPFVKEMSKKTIYELEHLYDDHDQRALQQSWRPVYTLCRLKYWQRAWIVQEILKAKSMILLYGEHQLNWHDLRVFLEKLQRADPCPAPLQEVLLEDHIAGFVRDKDFTQAADLKTSQSLPRSMREVLLAYGYCSCGEQRDHVFALLSLGKDGQQLEPDYAMPLHELFMKVIHLWGATDGANVLVLARRMVNRLLFDDKSAGPESGPQTFTIKMVEVHRKQGHDSCIDSMKCCTNTCNYEANFTASPQDGNRLSQMQLDARRLTVTPRVFIFGNIIFSQLRCSDKIMQIEDTLMFVVARYDISTKTWAVIGRLAVIVDEIDGQPQLQTLWRPWQSMQSRKLISRGKDSWEVSLNTYSLRKILQVIKHTRYKIYVTATSETITRHFDVVHWEDEPTAVEPFGAIEQVREIYHAEKERNQSAHDQTSEINVSQAYQVLQSLKMDLTLGELPSWKPRPSWRELLGR